MDDTSFRKPVSPPPFEVGFFCHTLALTLDQHHLGAPSRHSPRFTKWALLGSAGSRESGVDMPSAMQGWLGWHLGSSATDALEVPRYALVLASTPVS